MEADGKGLGTHKYGCVLAPLPNPLAQQIKDWATENIIDTHLGPGGLEANPHLTLKYGFKDGGEDTVREVRALLTRLGPIPVKLLGLSLFRSGYGKWKNEDGDVLKVDVESAELREANAALTAGFDCHDKYPEYKPHITVAYLKPEASALYTEEQPPFCHTSVVLNEVEWSGADGSKEVFSLSYRSLFPIAKTLSANSVVAGGALVPPPEQKGSRPSDQELYKVAEGLDDGMGYGQLFRHEDGRLWLVGGDWYERDFLNHIKEELTKLVGPDKWMIEAEAFPPKGESGWTQVYPKRKALKSNPPAPHLVKHIRLPGRFTQKPLPTMVRRRVRAR